VSESQEDRPMEMDTETITKVLLVIVLFAALWALRGD
jgi:hypothetical protein